MALPLPMPLPVANIAKSLHSVAESDVSLSNLYQHWTTGITTKISELVFKLKPLCYHCFQIVARSFRTMVASDKICCLKYKLQTKHKV